MNEFNAMQSSINTPAICPSAIHIESNHATLPIVSYLWNFRHRLVMYYWYLQISPSTYFSYFRLKCLRFPKIRKLGCSQSWGGPGRSWFSRDFLHRGSAQDAEGRTCWQPDSSTFRDLLALYDVRRRIVCLSSAAGTTQADGVLPLLGCAGAA